MNQWINNKMVTWRLCFWTLELWNCSFVVTINSRFLPFMYMNMHRFLLCFGIGGAQRSWVIFDNRHTIRLCIFCSCFQSPILYNMPMILYISYVIWYDNMRYIWRQNNGVCAYKCPQCPNVWMDLFQAIIARARSATARRANLLQDARHAKMAVFWLQIKNLAKVSN